jgi:heme-degrading monooxygenase HmoA
MYHKSFLEESRNIWIRSYKKYSGFVKTLVLRNRKNKNEFITIDIWISKKHADKFFHKNLEKLLKVSKVPKKYISRISYNLMS